MAVDLKTQNNIILNYDLKILKIDQVTGKIYVFAFILSIFTNSKSGKLILTRIFKPVLMIGPCINLLFKNLILYNFFFILIFKI